MQIEIFTGDSGTTAEKDNVEKVEDYFRGGFLTIKDLSLELSSYGNVTTHIFSEEYGYLQGSDSITELKLPDKVGVDATRDFSKAVSDASRTADVIVILLTKFVFEETVKKQWDDLVSNAKSNSIWCIGASSNAVESVDIEKLQLEAGSVIVYERVGVARISTECKDELIETVSQASSK
jgi:hypothetical protein